MSYFDTIYADHLLPHRARTVYMYLRDRGDAQQKYGFRQTSEEFLEDGIPHIQMQLVL